MRNLVLTLLVLVSFALSSSPADAGIAVINAGPFSVAEPPGDGWVVKRQTAPFAAVRFERSRINPLGEEVGFNVITAFERAVPNPELSAEEIAKRIFSEYENATVEEAADKGRKVKSTTFDSLEHLGRRFQGVHFLVAPAGLGWLNGFYYRKEVSVYVYLPEEYRQQGRVFVFVFAEERNDGTRTLDQEGIAAFLQSFASVEKSAPEAPVAKQSD